MHPLSARGRACSATRAAGSADPAPWLTAGGRQFDPWAQLKARVIVHVSPCLRQRIVNSARPSHGCVVPSGLKWQNWCSPRASAPKSLMGHTFKVPGTSSRWNLPQTFARVCAIRARRGRRSRRRGRRPAAGRESDSWRPSGVGVRHCGSADAAGQPRRCSTVRVVRQDAARADRCQCFFSSTSVSLSLRIWKRERKLLPSRM